MPNNKIGQKLEEQSAIPATSFVHRTDFVLTLLIWVMCGVLYYITTTFEEVSHLLAQNIGPEWFPQLPIWTIFVLSLALPFEHFFQKGKALFPKRKGYFSKKERFFFVERNLSFLHQEPFLFR